MSQKRHTPEQIIAKLREAEVELAKGQKTEEMVRKLGITEQTYCRWRKEYGGMDVSQARRLKELETENQRLKKLVADQALDIQILKEVDINLKAGRRPMLHAEDVIRYGAEKIEVNKEAVIELFRAVKNQAGAGLVGISHFCLSSALSAPDVIEEISNILDLGNPKSQLWLSGQTGIETGSPKLIKKHMAGKCKPFKPEDWPEVVVDSFEILSRNNWLPCGTLILGLPGETEHD